MMPGVVDPWRPRPVRIASVHHETKDVVTFALDAPGFTFAPGQFNMLYLFGLGEVAISISGGGANGGRANGGRSHGAPLEHTLRAVGTVTNAMARLRKGDTLGLRGPFGSEWPIREAEGGDLVVIAGGVGLPPLRPVIRHALRQRDRFRRVTLLYGARTPEDFVHRRELEIWGAREPGLVRTIVDYAGPGWRGRVGVVPALIEELDLDPRRTIAMTCGPEVMMRFAVRALAERGLPLDRIYVSLERNMKCAMGLCGHCQYVPYFICKDGPVLRFDRVARLFDRREM